MGEQERGRKDQTSLGGEGEEERKEGRNALLFTDT